METTRCMSGSQQPTPLRDDLLDSQNGACRPRSSPTSNAASTPLGRVSDPLALRIRSGRTEDGDDRAATTTGGGGWLGMGGGGIGERGGRLRRQVRRRRLWHSVDGITQGQVPLGLSPVALGGSRATHWRKPGPPVIDGAGLRVMEGARCTAPGDGLRETIRKL
jgi:hypothetical protein